MATHQEQKQSDAQTLRNAASSGAAAAKAAGKAAVGNYAGAALDLLKNEQIRNAILATVLVMILLIASCFMVIGSAITGTVENLSRTWSESWDENWEEQGVSSDGSALYLYTLGALNALDDTILDTIKGLFRTDHTVNGSDATNRDLGSETDIYPSDYETTIKSIFDEASLTGHDGALMSRIEMIKGRVAQRGKQIANLATAQYGFEAMGIAIAQHLMESYGNPILYRGLGSANVTVDTTAFTLSDIQALKILAAYSIQNDCNLTEIDMYDLMDYCGWYDINFTSLDTSSLGEASIYEEGTATARYEQEIGGVVDAGQSLGGSVILLSAPTVPYWRGTFAPQWYYEELAQIRNHNNNYFSRTSGTQQNDIPWGVTSADGEIDTDAFSKLSSFQPYGLIDKIFTSANATLRISRSDYHEADDFVEEALELLAGTSLGEAWTNAYAEKSSADAYGNTLTRTEDDLHSFTFVGSSYGTTRAGTSNGVKTISYKYYLTNDTSGGSSAIYTVGSDGAAIMFSGLSPSTTYSVWMEKTVTTRIVRPVLPDPGDLTPVTPDGSGSTVKTTTSTTYTQLVTFTTLSQSGGMHAYQLNLDLNIVYGSRSIDSLAQDLMGLWPGSFSETETGSDGRVYAQGHADNPNLVKTWTDTYTDPQGNAHTLEFERMQDYQQEAYEDIVKALSEMLGVSSYGIYDPSSQISYGNDILAVANAEYEYYTANNLYEGARYWQMVKDAIGWTLPYDSAWCVAFVYCCAYQCGYIGEGEIFGPDWIFYVEGAYEKITQAGQCDAYNSRTQGYKPVAGDLVFFGIPKGSTIDMTHIAIVESVSSTGQLNIIHGNSHDKVEKTTYPNYQIGSLRYAPTNEQIVAYIHPHYPVTSGTDPAYISVNGLTRPTVTSRYITADGMDLMLSGLGRLRQSQLQPFLTALEDQYTSLYQEELQAALDAEDWESFQTIWNSICSSSQSTAFRQAQLSLTNKLYVMPMLQAAEEANGFDWNKTRTRMDMLMGLVTSTDQQDVLLEVLSYLSQNMDPNITDEEFTKALKTDNLLGETLAAYADRLWPQDNEQLRLAWISANAQLLNELAAGETIVGSLTDEFYISIPNPDPDYRGHPVTDLTEYQIARIKNTLYGEYGINLAACIVIAQSIRDNVDRDPRVTYDNFVEECQYVGGYLNRDPSVYDTEIVNEAFEYVFIKGGSGVQEQIYCFYTPDTGYGVIGDDDYQALFYKPLNFIIQVGFMRFFNWDL